jgi:hypothetical protein
MIKNNGIISLTAISCLFISTLTNAGNFSELDISGIKIGDNFDQIKRTVKKSSRKNGKNPPDRLGKNKDGGSIIGHSLKNDSIAAYLLPSMQHEVVYSIMKAKKYSFQTSPAPQDFEAALINKYGEPTYLLGSSSGTEQYFWKFDENGKLIPPVVPFKLLKASNNRQSLVNQALNQLPELKNRRICDSNLSSDKLFVLQMQYFFIQKKDFDPVNSTNENCGRLLSATMFKSTSKIDTSFMIMIDAESIRKNKTKISTINKNVNKKVTIEL